MPTNTIRTIENRLARHYLRSDGPAGASPIRFFDATLAELTAALGFAPTDEEGAWSTLISSLGYWELKWAFDSGYVGNAAQSDDGPGWFRYLLFSCAIEALPSERFGSNNFRHRVAGATGVSLSNVPGLAALWRRLQTWLDSRQVEGQPYRSLILPNPETMSQIGYSVNGAFPTWRDADRLNKIWGQRTSFKTLGPLAAKREIGRQLGAHRWSDGFKAAFHDFETRLDNGQTLIAQHPFWLQVLKISSRGRVPITWPVAELTSDIDGTSSITVSSLNSKSKLVELDRFAGASSVEIGVEEFIDLLCTTGAEEEFGWLSRDASDGALVFNDNGWKWKADHAPATSRVRLLILRRHMGDAPPPGIRFGDWILTNPLGFDQATTVIALVRPRSSNDFQPSAVRLAGGIKVSSGYLGFPSILPGIQAAERCEVSLAPVRETKGELKISASAGSRFELRCGSTIEGTWMLSVNERNHLVAQFPVSFTTEADEWSPAEFGLPPSAFEICPEVAATETATVIDNEIALPISIEPAKSDAISDLAEAIYAAGRTGWSENELVPMVGTFFPDLPYCQWDVLRLLSDSGWLDCYRSATWAARRWYLRPPSLKTYSTGLVYLDGAAPRRLRRRFETLVHRAGGSVFAHSGPNEVTIRALLARIDDHDGLAKDLGLQAGLAQVELPSENMCVTFTESANTGEYMEVASHFDWEKERFLLGPAPSQAAVAVERLVQPRHRLQDVYRVRAESGAAHYFDTRNAAIASGYVAAGRPMYAVDHVSGTITRTSADGGLPGPIANFLRLLSGRNPRLVRIEGGYRYVYPYTPEALPQLKAWLGPLLDLAIKDTPAYERHELLKMALTKRIGRAGALIMPQGASL